MKIEFNFQGLGHTKAIEEHIAHKLSKLDEIISSETSPRNILVHIKKDAQVNVELSLRTKNLHIDSHASAYDLYAAADDAVAKMIVLVKKQKEKHVTQRQTGIDRKSFDQMTDGADLDAEDED
jgi:ribosomal subunit interface protein